MLPEKILYVQKAYIKEKLYKNKMLTYALLVSKNNKRERVFREVKDLAGESLRYLQKVYGEYDLIAGFKMQNEEKLSLILNKIKEIDGVLTLKTCTVIHKTRESDFIPRHVLEY